MRVRSLGLGLTSACNLECPHCYSRGHPPVHLPLERLRLLLDTLAPESVNIGTGEGAMHPDFESAVEEVLSRGIPLSITTNGLSILRMNPGMLRALHDVDVSLDFPDRAGHDAWRSEGSFDIAIESVRRCLDAGVTCSVAFCLMSANAARASAMCDLCGSLGVALRVNVYKPVHDRALSPGYDAFWSAICSMGAAAPLVSCSEPIVNAALAAGGLENGGSLRCCGERGMRVSPLGELNGCVYVTGSGVRVEDVVESPSSLYRAASIPSSAPVPGACADCPWLPLCGGGCFGRRFYTGIDRRDEFCFVDRGVPGIPKPALGGGERWMHSDYLCTLIYFAG